MELIEEHLVHNVKIQIMFQLVSLALNHAKPVQPVNTAMTLSQLMEVNQVSSPHVTVLQDITVLKEQNISTSILVTMEHLVLTQIMSHKIVVLYVQMVIGVVQVCWHQNRVRLDYIIK